MIKTMTEIFVSGQHRKHSLYLLNWIEISKLMTAEKEEEEKDDEEEK